jgi:hypothetical protein
MDPLSAASFWYAPSTEYVTTAATSTFDTAGRIPAQKVYKDRAAALFSSIDEQQKAELKELLEGLIVEKHRAYSGHLDNDSYRDILEALHAKVSVGLQKKLENAKLNFAWSMYSGSQAANKIQALAEQFGIKDIALTQVCSPNCQVAPLYPDEHYAFLSRHTHILSGTIALSSKAESYAQGEHVEGALEAVDILFSWKEAVRVGEITASDYASKKNLIEDIAKPEVLKLFPPTGSSRDEIIYFYRSNNPVFKFTLIKDQTETEYEIKPLLLRDAESGRYYLHIELGKSMPTSDHDQRRVMLNFSGRGLDQRQQIVTAAFLLIATGVRQIVPTYSNYGINHLLNPDLSAATTSIKGSVNPHLLAYNYLAQNCPVNLEIYAYSYGNLAATQFMNRVRERDPEKPILYIGSGVAKSLLDIAKEWTGGVVASIADLCKLLNTSDVSTALSQPNITSLLFNHTADAIIPLGSQIEKPLDHDLKARMFIFTEHDSEGLHNSSYPYHPNAVHLPLSNQFLNRYQECSDRHYRHSSHKIC